MASKAICYPKLSFEECKFDHAHQNKAIISSCHYSSMTSYFDMSLHYFSLPIASSYIYKQKKPSKPLCLESNYILPLFDLISAYSQIR
jgi:hypothetical protein